MSLEDELARLRRRIQRELSAEDNRLIEVTLERRRMLQVAEHGLAVGDTLPDFALPDSHGRIVTSDWLLDRGPLVLAFFRGGWCPYCAAALRALEAARPAIESMGARLVGVAPESPVELRRTGADRGLSFLLLSDEDNAFARLCGIHYLELDALKGMYRRLHVHFRVRDLDIPWSLPLPATYVVAADGRITWRFVDPDWAYRAEPDQLVAAVARLAQSGRGAGPG
jgi:peroxiredoxin